MMIIIVVRVRVLDVWARDGKCGCHGSVALLLWSRRTCTLLVFVHLVTHVRKEDWERFEKVGLNGGIAQMMSRRFLTIEV